MVIVESVALAIMVSNDLVVPLVLSAGARLLRRRRHGRSPADRAPGCDLRDPAARLCLLSLAGDAAACLDRPAFLRRHRAVRAGLLRRPVLAARHGARRDRRHDDRLRRLGLYAAAAELRRRWRSSVGHRHRRPVRHRRAQAAGAARPRPAAAGPRRRVEPRRSTSSPMWRSRSAASRPRSSACRPTLRAVQPRARHAELPAVALVGDGGGTDARRSRAISARSARATRSKASRPPQRHQPRVRGTEADFHLLRYAEHLLASAIGAASSRLVLSLLLRRRTVSTKAALKLLDDANAAIQYSRDILQTALDHVRQGIAVFDKDLQLICWNRQFGDILDLPPELVRVGIGLDEIMRFHAERGALGPGEVDDLVAERVARYASACRAVPGTLRRAGAGDRGAREPHAGRRPRHHLHRHHRPASRPPRRWNAPTRTSSAAFTSAPRN